MSVYHQMGNDSQNLLYERDLADYAGAILSPVNEDASSMRTIIKRYRASGDGEVVFDPQLYYPQTERKKLRNWSYYPSDFETADLSVESRWKGMLPSLVETLVGLRPDAVCSPAFVPKMYVNAYYDLMTRVAGSLIDLLSATQIEVLQTVLVGLDDLTDPHRLFAIASIVTRTRASRVYLVMHGNVAPRREIVDTEALKGAMRLISTLERSGMQVLVGFTSSDVVLWKAAGATACATGKFWNLRRFTPSRWEPPERGGGQLDYWFEEAFLAALRHSDVDRVAKAGMISKASLANPFGVQILTQLAENPRKAWLALGWRQYMYWFMDVEKRITRGETAVENILRDADAAWPHFRSDRQFMEEPENDGRWIRPWLRALIEYQD